MSGMKSCEYGIYSAADIDGAVRVLTEAFTRREPLGIAVGMTAPDFEAFVRLLAPKAAAEQLTVVARDSETCDIVGVMLTEDSASPAPDGLDTLNPRFAPIFDFLHELEAEHRAGGRSPRPGEWLHLFLLAVAEQAGGRGGAPGMGLARPHKGARRGPPTAAPGTARPGAPH